MSQSENQARKKPINIIFLRGTVSRTSRNRPWDKRDPSPGQTGTRPWDKPVFFLFSSTVKSPFCPICGTGGGSSLGRLSRKGRQKNVYVFSVYSFFRPQKTLAQPRADSCIKRSLESSVELKLIVYGYKDGLQPVLLSLGLVDWKGWLDIV